MYENRYLRTVSMPTTTHTRRCTRRDDYRKRLRDRQERRLMRQYGLSREYARSVVEMCYRKAG